MTGREVVLVWVLALHKGTTRGCGDLINGASYEQMFVLYPLQNPSWLEPKCILKDLSCKGVDNIWVLLTLSFLTHLWIIFMFKVIIPVKCY
jgi:hypothetical protein